MPGAAGPGRAAGPPMAPPSPTTSVKQDFARLTLGMFARSFDGYPLTFAYVGQAEAPQGQADVLDVKGAPNFAVRLFVNVTTHLPVMISWTQPPTPAQLVITAPGQAKPANLPGRRGGRGRPRGPVGERAAGREGQVHEGRRRSAQGLHGEADGIPDLLRGLPGDREPDVSASPAPRDWCRHDGRDDVRRVSDQSAKINPKKFETVK